MSVSDELVEEIFQVENIASICAISKRGFEEQKGQVS
jgi:hypothetical protein